MGKKVMLAAVMVFVVGAGGLHFLNPAAAQSAPPKESDSSKGKAIHFTFEETDSRGLDLGNDGPSAGDQFLFSGEVFKHESDEKVGDYDGHCVLVHAGHDPQSGKAICTVTVTSDKGQIVGTGLIDLEDVRPGGSYKFPLLGGTEAFRGARGQFVVSISDDKEADVIVELIDFHRS